MSQCQVAQVISRLRALPIREAQPASLLLVTLDELGWQRSAREKASVAADGSPTPWWTYPATAWLAITLRPDHRVFEFGSGNSTLWLARRVAEVHSVEHDPDWARIVRATLPDNAHLDLVETHGTDADADADDPYLTPLAAGSAYDLVIVDGMGRNACVDAAITSLNDSGMILLDDADRLSYRPAHRALKAAGFGRLDFFGPKPGVGHMSTTCLFSRDFNPWSRGLEPPPVSGY
jgi:hypothetical protein